ncbi:2OG-Fe(II) oxygenase [Pararhodobacter zhoushanensis]|uniref:2OG-Fe(II) oxygenase n=1 Tax=Pararhodobacter zhoushanensis TaxID=2479545 RepID=A0ABT3GUX0_9RHOB|nr:2OG-Fe(II) oxygenase [Pararhodobacter zhoushanensis]MCW1931328.1 2OG-Fe(II) oxygenase [Pararhodobacter zhoushanensis]
MRDILDLDRYPLDRPGSPAWHALVGHCRAQLAADGMFSLPGLVTQAALTRAMAEITPLMPQAFTHKRSHNIYFKPTVPGLPDDHPALCKVETASHTLCADQMPQSVPVWIYEWAPFQVFLAAAMDLPALFPMLDPLARVNVMTYRTGERLNWHFDRSDFTTTILLQAPEGGGEFLYHTDLRSDDNPNHDGVARLLRGEDPLMQTLRLSAGTLNVFKGRNTPHCVTPVEGSTDRVITVFSYYPRPGVVFSPEERLGFYGREG